MIQACYTNDVNQEICAQTVTKVWNPPGIPYDITLTPEYSLNLVGEQHTVTATITGSQVTGIEVIFTVISGPNTAEIGTATTNANGEASTTYTGNGGVGTDNIQACFTLQEEAICSNVVKKEWTIEAISLSPLLAQNELGEEHTVTATIQTLKGAPVAGVEVRFTIKSGPNSPATSSDTTDSNGEATYSYTGNTVGTDVIQACFTNATGEDICTDYEGRVGSDAIKEWGDPCPAIEPNPDELPNAVKNEPYSQQFTGYGGTEPYTFAVTSGNLPPGLSPLTAGGLLSGTPTQEGTYTFTVTVTDNDDCTGSRQYTLRVCPTITLSPDAGALPDGVVGEPYSQTITASVAPATFQLTGNLPPGLVGTEGSYVISGTPTQTGTWPFTITATTAEGCSASHTYTIRIVDAIPTVTEWGMIMLLLGLAVITVIIMRRRQVGQ